MTPLDYQHVRGRIRSGDIIAQSHHGWGSWYDLQIQAVRLFQRSEYSHVGMAIRWGNRVMMLEAVSAGVRPIPLSLIGDFYWIPMNKPLSEEAELFALDQIGERYSKWQCFLEALHLLRRGDNGAWQCAKLLNMILVENGIDYGDALSPSKLIRAAQDDGKTLRFINNPRTLALA